MKLFWNNAKYNYNIFLYDIMAKTRRKPNAFIKKVVAYYKAHKKEGIKYSDAIKKVANSYKKGGDGEEEPGPVPGSVPEPGSDTVASEHDGGNSQDKQEQNQEQQEQQGGKRRRKSGKKAKKSKKSSRRTRRR